MAWQQDDQEHMYCQEHPRLSPRDKARQQLCICQITSTSGVDPGTPTWPPYVRVCCDHRRALARSVPARMLSSQKSTTPTSLRKPSGAAFRPCTRHQVRALYKHHESACQSIAGSCDWHTVLWAQRCRHPLQLKSSLKGFALSWALNCAAQGA